ncbi:unnamed protein product [Cylicocyclus nassatus]|uniref:Uncharacterized protein n=1 Tax=Cylicocyclus nassatus TaxID=53992 RepID=A0AA36DP98_CYLNA|nr:unnamed protein product [Cylicocyclus nassatus]
MLFSTSCSYTLPQLYAEERSRTPSLLNPDTLSIRDRQIQLYCQTIAGLVAQFHERSLTCIIRLQRRLQKILDIETHIDLTTTSAQSHFERNLQLFLCLVDYRLRSLALESPYQFETIVNKLQLLLIESGSERQPKSKPVKKLKRVLRTLLKSV